METYDEIAIVTGAGSGIGRAVTMELSREPLAVLAVGRSAERLAATAELSPGVVEPVRADVCDAGGRGNVIEAVGARRVRCLIHLAGDLPVRRVVDTSAATWERAFALHVHARLHLTLGLLRNLSPNGRVLFVASRSGEKARKGAAAYCSSYAASAMLASCLKLELSEQGIEVVNALPGAVPTALLLAAMESDPDVFPDGNEYRRLGETGQWVRPEVVGKFFRWLAIAAEPDFIHEQTTVDISDAAHHEHWLGTETLFHPAPTAPPDLMNAPFNIPPAWRGAELFERDDWLHTLEEREVAELESAVDRAVASEVTFEEISPEGFVLPGLARVLSRIQDSLERGSGAALIRGLPMERFQGERARFLFWGLAQHMGTPLSQSADGARLFSVRDERLGAEDRRTRGPNTRKRLSFHTDRCDVIGFLCLRQAKAGGENSVVSSVSLFNALLSRQPRLVDVLRQPFVYKRHNVDGGNELSFCEQPIFSVFEGHFAANFLRVLIERADAEPDLPDLTPLQREALDALEELAEDPALHVSFRQEPGDILFLNNWVTFHRRAEFVDYEDPARRRELLRVWLAVPNSRPLASAFAANYGATGAGEVRGGMRPRD